MLYEIATNYFNSMSPLAARFSKDATDTNMGNAIDWLDSGHSHQGSVLIKNTSPKTCPESPSYLKSNEKGGCKFSCGQKLICDEQTGATWRDEHSAPFTWKSRSLLRLCESPKCVPALPPADVSHNRKFSATSCNSTGVVVDATPDTSANIGTFAHFYTKLKFIPGKLATLDDKKLITRLTNGAVKKFHGTLQYFSGNKPPECQNIGENDHLVTDGRAVTVVLGEKYRDDSSSARNNARTDSDERINLIVSSLSCSNSLGKELDQNLLEKSEEIDESSCVAKTGFDFLDNW